MMLLGRRLRCVPDVVSSADAPLILIMSHGSQLPRLLGVLVHLVPMVVLFGDLRDRSPSGFYTWSMPGIAVLPLELL